MWICLNHPIQGFSYGTVSQGIDTTDQQKLQKAGQYWQNLLELGKLISQAEVF